MLNEKSKTVTCYSAVTPEDTPVTLWSSADQGKKNVLLFALAAWDHPSSANQDAKNKNKSNTVYMSYTSHGTNESLKFKSKNNGNFMIKVTQMITNYRISAANEIAHNIAHGQKTR